MTGAELRASILQAAVQGKLVPQDPNDEPACVLLERIREERRELVKQKKVKAPRGGESVITRYPDGTVWEQRGKGAAVEITDEVPFDIPDGWEWARIGSLIEIERGGSPRPIKSYITTREDGINWIKIGDTDKDGKYITQTREKIRAEGMKKSRYVVPGDFLLTNSMSFGRPYILQTDGCIHDGWLVFRKPDTVFDKDYLYWLLSSPAMFRQFAGLAAGSAVKNLNIDKVKDSFVPIPPLAEQRRIVAKLDALLPLVERYTKLDRERTELNAGIEGAMRASILQAAVQGQLTEREDGDEPASKLLEHIREERRELVKQKKAKAPRGGESVITRYPDGTVWEQRGKGAAVEITDEVPFDIPDGWEWARLPCVAELRIGKTPTRGLPQYWDRGDVPWFSIADMKPGQIIVKPKERVTQQAIHECFKAGLVPAGTLVMSFKLTIGRMSILGVDAVHNEAIVSITPHYDSENIIRNYLLHALPHMIRTVDVTSAIKGATLNSKKMAQILIPVPPLAEQQRIVAKLDELLPKTERLGKLVS